MAIGALLLATLLTVRRKDGATKAAAPETAIAPEPSDGDDDTSWVASEEAAPATPIAYDPGETPEWEPHAAPAQETPVEAESETEPAETARESAAEDQAPEDLWSEPTATALSDAAPFEQAGRPETDEGDRPTEDADDVGSFSSFLDDEPMATPVEDASLQSPGGSLSDDAPVDGGDRTLEEVSAGVAADDTAPEDEPFERAGRWWFKRGSELLVYNEQTGEWVPSPTALPKAEPAPSPGIGPDATATQTISDISSAEPEPEPEPEPELATDDAPQQGFWRCPACGAVNGSTAASCRMCFAERPAG